MHLLLVEPDPNLARIMGDLFIADGYSVIAAADAIGGTRAVVSTRVDAAVISQDLPGGDGLEVVRALRRRESAGTQALVVLIAARADEDLRRRAAALGVTQVLARPVSLLDLAELVRAAPVPAPAPSRPFHPTNAADLAGFWARRATGVLHIEQPHSAVLVLLANGGPVGADGRQAIQIALQGGEVRLDACPVDGVGDREGLAGALWTATHAWATQSRPDVGEDLMVHPHSLTHAAASLPLRAALLGVLRGLDGPTLRSQIAEALAEDLEAVAVDLHALATLGFVNVQPAGRVRAAAPRPPLPHAIDRFTDVRDIDLGPRRPVLGGGTRRPADALPISGPPPTPAPRPARTVEVEDVTDPVIAQRPPRSGITPRPEKKPPASRPSPSSSSSSLGGPRPAGGRGRIRAMPPLLERSIREAKPDGAPRAGDLDSAQQLIRLRREAEVVRAADPWTVLGVPRDADAAIVAQVGARMEARYAALSGSTNPEVVSLAAQIQNRIKAATEATRARADARSRPEAASLQAGRRAAQVEAWAQADAAYGRARELAPDSAEALTGLGWARFHNRDVDRAEREEDALAYLELALQFNPAHLPASWHLATLCHLLGRDAEARTHARRVLKLAPEHPDAAALLRRLGG